MPHKSGLEANREVLELFNRFEKQVSIRIESTNGTGTLADRVGKITQSKVSAIRPFVCFQTQLSDAIFFENFVIPEERADCVLSKPLRVEQLEALCKILGLT